VAAFVEQEGASELLASAPAGHQKRAMLGMKVLVPLHAAEPADATANSF
jgi:hypothetical protein